MPDALPLPPLPADAKKRTYVLAAVGGVLRWLPAMDESVRPARPIHPVRVAGIPAVRRG